MRRSVGGSNQGEKFVPSLGPFIDKAQRVFWIWCKVCHPATGSDCTFGKEISVVSVAFENATVWLCFDNPERESSAWRVCSVAVHMEKALFLPWSLKNASKSSS